MSAIQVNENAECGICMNKLRGDESYVSVEPCGHQFHTDCEIHQYIAAQLANSGWAKCPASCKIKNKSPLTSYSYFSKMQGKLISVPLPIPSNTTPAYLLSSSASASAVQQQQQSSSSQHQSASAANDETMHETFDEAWNNTRARTAYAENISIDQSPLLKLYSSWEQNEREKCCHLQICYQKQNEEKPTVIEAIIGQKSSMASEEVLIYLCFFLNIAVVRPCAITSHPCYTSIDDCLQAAISSQNLLQRLMYALCTGEELPKDVDALGAADRQGAVLASFLATSIVMRIENPHRPIGSGLQGYFSDLMMSFNVKPDLWDILTKFRIADSRQVVLRKADRQIENFGRDIALTIKSKYDLVIAQFDNLGFAQKKGYLQTISLLWQVVPFQELVDVGVYDEENRIPVEKHVNLPTGSHYKPKKSDYQVLGGRVLGGIEMMLQSMPNMPPLEDLLHMEPSEYLNVSIPHRLPHRLREELANPNNFHAAAVVDETAGEEEGKKEEEKNDNDSDDDDVDDDKYALRRKALALYNSIYEANNTIPGQILERDLNDHKAVELLAQIITSTTESIQLRNDVETIATVGKLPIQPHLGAISACDGSPSYAIARLKSQGKFKTLNNCPGGFHTYLEGLNLIGRLFRCSHLELLIEAWRITLGQKQWFLEPGDPRQTEAESIDMVKAHYYCAALACALYLQRDEITAEEALDFMILRAKQHACIADLLQSLRFYENAHMMRESERGEDAMNSFYLYQTSQRLQLPLYFVTHATKYARIGMDERYRWEHATQAEILAHGYFIFRSRTRLGSYLWTDRVMEYYIMDMRKIHGKKAVKGIVTKLLRTLQSLPDYANANMKGKTLREQQIHDVKHATAYKEFKGTPTYSVTDVFIAAVAKIQETRLWAFGLPPLSPTDHKPIPNGYSLSGKELDAEYLDKLSIADRRLELYANTYMVEGARQFNAVERSEKDVPLTALKPFLADRVQQKLNDYRIKCSTNETDIAKGMTKAQIIDEINDHRQAVIAIATFHPQSSYITPTTAALNRMKKPELCSSLVMNRSFRWSHGQAKPIEPVTAQAQDATIDAAFLARICSHPMMSLADVKDNMLSQFRQPYSTKSTYFQQQQQQEGDTMSSTTTTGKRKAAVDTDLGRELKSGKQDDLIDNRDFGDDEL